MKDKANRISDSSLTGRVFALLQLFYCIFLVLEKAEEAKSLLMCIGTDCEARGLC